MSRKLNRTVSAMVPMTILAFTLAACAGGSPASGGKTSSPQSGSTAPAGLTEGIPTEVIKTKEDKGLHSQLAAAGIGDSITVAIDLSSPPARMIDANGKPAGFDVDFTKLLAEKIGVSYQISNVPLAQIIPGLAAKRYDVSIDNHSRTPEREAQVDMIEYMQGSGGIAIPATNPHKVTTEPTSMCGLHLAVLAGSYQEMTTVPQINEACAGKGKDKVEATSFQTNNEAILALGSRRVDAWIGNGTVAAYAAHQQPKVFKSMVMKDTWSHDNITLPKDSKFTPIVAAAFQKLMDDGSYGKVLKKWGISNYALTHTSLVQTPVTQQ